MEKLKQIYGIIECDSISFSFVFDSKDFLLKLLPPADVWLYEKINSLGFFQRQAKKNKWIPSKYLYGSSSEGYSIVFCVDDIPSMFNAVRTYSVNWVFYHSSGSYSQGIKGVRLRGGDVNSFYPSNRALSTSLQFDENHLLKEIQVVSKLLENKPCGKYRLIPHVDATITVNAFSSYHEKGAISPISANSSFTIEYSSYVDIVDAIKSIFELTQFLRFACYRNDISYDLIETYDLVADSKKRYDGCILIPCLGEYEPDEKKMRQIISYDFWGKNVGKMLTSIKNRELGFQHLCESLEDTKSYSSSRLLLIYTEFEREYRNLYGVNLNRSDEYIECKNEIIDWLKHYASGKKGKIKKYIKQEIKHINNTGASYSKYIENALLDCEAIMAPFIAKKYKGSYRKVIKELADRTQTMRNDLAHSNLNISFKPILLQDIKIIEELTYAIRLKKYNTDKEVQKSISNLFGDECL